MPAGDMASEAADQQQPTETDSMLEAGSQRFACAADESVVAQQEQKAQHGGPQEQQEKQEQQGKEQPEQHGQQEQQGKEQPWQLVDLHEQQQLGQLQEQLSTGSTSTVSSGL